MFFGICYEIPKKHWFFDVLGSNSKKTLGFFGILQNSKKTSSFPKIPKIFGQVDNFFGILEFWKTRGFWNFGFTKFKKTLQLSKNKIETTNPNVHTFK